MREQPLDPNALGQSAMRHWRASPLWLSVCAVVWAGLLVAWVPTMYARALKGSRAVATRCDKRAYVFHGTCHRCNDQIVDPPLS